MQLIYKKDGETPLQALNRLRRTKPEFKDSTLSYAGRLDPMAEGLLLVLVDEENDNREEYLELNKAYEFEVLFGVTTDSFDVLGIVQSVTPGCEIDKNALQALVSQYSGMQTFRYPPFSSATVDGKQLWQWAREGKIDKIDLPTKTVGIHSFEYSTKEEMKGSEVRDSAITRIKNVSGDFRQEAIVNSWENAFSGNEDAEFLIASFTMRCSSGTYVRRIAERMGEKEGCKAIAWRIKRTSVGDYSLEDIKNA